VHDAAPVRRRSAPALAALVVGVVAIVAVLAAVFFEMRGRLDRLERGGDAPAAASIRRPSTPALSIVGVVDDASGRARTVALGSAVHVRRRTAAASDVVADAAARFLAGRPDGRIEAHSDGDPPSTVLVTGRRGRRDPEAPAGVVLFELAHDMGAPTAETAVGAPPKTMLVRRAFMPDETAALEEAVGLDGRRAESAATAPYLRASFHAQDAGSGVFDESGLLRGLVAGPSRPGLVLAAPLIFAAFDLLETSAAEPLR
jgi:HAMP domain-containing protein